MGSKAAFARQLLSALRMVTATQFGRLNLQLASALDGQKFDATVTAAEHERASRLRIRSEVT